MRCLTAFPMPMLMAVLMVVMAPSARTQGMPAVRYDAMFAMIAAGKLSPGDLVTSTLSLDIKYPAWSNNSLSLQYCQ